MLLASVLCRNMYFLLEYANDYHYDPNNITVWAIRAYVYILTCLPSIIKVYSVHQRNWRLHSLATVASPFTTHIYVHTRATCMYMYMCMHVEVWVHVFDLLHPQCTQTVSSFSSMSETSQSFIFFSGWLFLKIQPCLTPTLPLTL